MYDEKHRFFTVSSNPGKKDLTHQKGAREHLLCKDCEERFARYEKYFSEAFFDGVSVDFRDDGQDLYIEGIDYQRTKLLFLSVLWRMSVSSLSFFRSVALGPHEERIRVMLLADDPGTQEQYGVTAVVPYSKREHLGHFVLPPDDVRVGANRVYRIVIGGILYLFHVPGKLLPQSVISRLLSPEGKWVFTRKQVEDLGFLFHDLMKIGEGINRREGWPSE